MDGHPIDGSLTSWGEVEPLVEWDTLLLGNGFSVNLWRGFDYSSLYEEAERGTKFGKLHQEDKRLFEQLGTQNFELVLGDLRTAIRMVELLVEDPEPYYERYRSIQAALGAAVRAAHIDRIETPDASLAAIRRELLMFEWVFTTGYDLMVYWAMGYGETFDGFCDCFWSNGRNEFDPQSARIRTGTTPVFFLHGALHLIVEGTGVTRKLTRNARTLLAQFGQPIPDDPQARPLLITEGSSHDKVRAIDNNDYLTFCLSCLKHRKDPLVVFGHGLGVQDQHLLDAINEHPDRPVAVSIRPGSKNRVRARQASIRGVLETPELYFFNSETHPLGDPALTKKTTRIRDLFKRSATGKPADAGMTSF